VVGTAAVAAVGDVLTVENGTPGTQISILDWWGLQNTNPGFQQLIYPSGHDTTRGIRGITAGVTVTRFKPINVPIPVRAQELLQFTIGGAATAGDVDIGVVTLYYENMPGLSGSYIGYDELMARGSKLCTVDQSLTGIATGDWSVGVAINATTDLLLANRQYAWVGAEAQVQIAAVSMNAPDFGNVRIACPVQPGDGDRGAEYFINLAWETNLPTIPVFNSGNRANILLCDLMNENTAATICSFNLVLLDPPA
jgi:hypothetical protein